VQWERLRADELELGDKQRAVAGRNDRVFSLRRELDVVHGVMPGNLTKPDRTEWKEVHPWSKTSKTILGRLRHREGPEMEVVREQLAYEGPWQREGLCEVEEDGAAARFRTQRLDRAVRRGNGVDLREREVLPDRVLVYRACEFEDILCTRTVQDDRASPEDRRQGGVDIVMRANTTIGRERLDELIGWLVERENHHALHREAISDDAGKTLGAVRSNHDLAAAPEDPQRRDRPTSRMRGETADAYRGLFGLTSLAAGRLGH
jgi:hypothetical protein